MVAVALANSVFFNVSEKAAQSDVALSLALTVAPFAVVGPLLGPMVERVRGGRRAIALASALGRGACCFFMAFWVHSLLLFPVAFFTLVFSKLYLVTKAALVPGTVERPDQLVLANSKLSVGGSLAGMVAGSFGVGLLNLFGAGGLLRFDIFVYLTCAYVAVQLTTVRRSAAATQPVGTPTPPPQPAPPAAATAPAPAVPPAPAPAVPPAPAASTSPAAAAPSPSAPPAPGASPPSSAWPAAALPKPELARLPTRPPSGSPLPLPPPAYARGAPWPPPPALPSLPQVEPAAPSDAAASMRPAPPPTGLPPGGIQLAAVATAALRFSVGFVSFLLVFTFRHHAAALIWYGLALGASQVGNVSGALLAPRLRRRAPEEFMLTGSSIVMGAVALVAGVVHWGTHWTVAVLLSAGIGVAAGSGKLAFDSMVQRDVPSRVRSRSFARFESGFQLAWALGGLVAVLVPITLSEGFVAIGTVSLVGAVAFAGGSVRARRGQLPAWFPGSAPRPSPPTAPAAPSGDRTAQPPGSSPPTATNNNEPERTAHRRPAGPAQPPPAPPP